MRRDAGSERVRAAVEAGAELTGGATRHGVDIAARYGGEEFAVILRHTRVSAAPAPDAGADDDPDAPPPGAGALVVAGRLRAAVADHMFPGHGGRRHARTPATVGVAELRPGEAVSDFVAAADAALCEGKRRGRDQVVARDA